MNPADVTACLLTRGDVNLTEILETLPYSNVAVWGIERDRADAYGIYGRYELIREATTRVVYVQDDDCLFESHEALLAAYQERTIVSTYGHGDNADGLEDFVLFHGGAIMDRELPERAFDMYDRAGYPRDEAFYRYCDLIVGGLSAYHVVRLPFAIDYEIAARPNRMAHMDGARELKHEIARRVRRIRLRETIGRIQVRA